MIFCNSFGRCHKYYCALVTLRADHGLRPILTPGCEKYHPVKQIILLQAHCEFRENTLQINLEMKEEK